jgi:hypothetical protein
MPSAGGENRGRRQIQLGSSINRCQYSYGTGIAVQIG